MLPPSKNQTQTKRNYNHLIELFLCGYMFFRCFGDHEKNIMNIQYISDSTGKTTGVFIPIAEWNELKSKYQGIDQEEIAIPPFQMDEVQKRLTDYRNNPDNAMDFDNAMDDIEKNL